MSRTLGQQFVVENVAGAGGTTGSTCAAQSAPDGYTIMMGHNLVEQVKAGSIKAYAVAIPERSPFTAKLNDALVKALEDPATKKRLLDLGAVLPNGQGAR